MPKTKQSRVADLSGDSSLAQIIAEAIAANMPNPGASSIDGFCRRNSMGRSTFYALPPELRPEIAEIGGLRRITMEAEAEWRVRILERTRQHQTWAQGVADHRPGRKPGASHRRSPYSTISPSGRSRPELLQSKEGAGIRRAHLGMGDPQVQEEPEPTPDVTPSPDAGALTTPSEVHTEAEGLLLEEFSDLMERCLPGGNTQSISSSGA